VNKKIIISVIALALSVSALSVSAEPKDIADKIARNAAYAEHLKAPHTSGDIEKIIAEMSGTLQLNADIALNVLNADTQKNISEYFNLSYSVSRNSSSKAEDKDNAYHCLMGVRSYILASIAKNKISGTELMKYYSSLADTINTDIIVDIDTFNKSAEYKNNILKNLSGENTDIVFDNLTGLSLLTADYYYKMLPVYDTSELKFNNDFSDVSENDWFYEAVSFVCSMSIFKGTSDTTFEPQTTMTRAMFITALSRTEQIGEYPGIYSDVANDSWYANAVAWAEKMGYLSWIDGYEFKPDQPITREEMVQTIYLCAKDKSKSVEMSDISSFSDYGEVSADKTDAFKWGYSAGIIKGNSDGTLNPKGTAKRCEVAQIFLNLFKFLQEK